jgi:hypothetical protein
VLVEYEDVGERRHTSRGWAPALPVSDFARTFAEVLQLKQQMIQATQGDIGGMSCTT